MYMPARDQSLLAPLIKKKINTYTNYKPILFLQRNNSALPYNHRSDFTFSRSLSAGHLWIRSIETLGALIDPCN